VFSGIVEGVGRVRTLRRAKGGGARLEVALPGRFGRVRRGESVCVSGVCLTALSEGSVFRADLSQETLRRTALGALQAGSGVNLERALRYGQRMSGHFVQGHSDGVVRLLAVRRRGNSWSFSFSLPRPLRRYVALKGSVALDGISLTVASLKAGRFSVAVIPHTLSKTTLRERKAGDRLNFEADMLVRHLLIARRRRDRF
jgi:riboflavin synthase